MNNFQLDTEQTKTMHQNMPYTQFIGLQIGKNTNDDIMFFLPTQRQHVGNTIRTSLHGGLLGGLMESCAQYFACQIQALNNTPKTININIDYLRPGLPQDAYIHCKMIKAGSTISSIWVEVWHTNSQKPITTARVLLEI